MNLARQKERRVKRREPGGRTFVMSLKQPADFLLEKVREAADKNGFLLEGNDQSGSFQGNGIFGCYQVNGDKLELVITKKPALLSWNRVEAEIRAFFSEEELGKPSAEEIENKRKELRASIKNRIRERNRKG